MFVLRAIIRSAVLRGPANRWQQNRAGEPHGVHPPALSTRASIPAPPAVLIGLETPSACTRDAGSTAPTTTRQPATGRGGSPQKAGPGIRQTSAGAHKPGIIYAAMGPQTWTREPNYPKTAHFFWLYPPAADGPHRGHKTGGKYPPIPKRRTFLAVPSAFSLQPHSPPLTPKRRAFFGCTRRPTPG